MPGCIISLAGRIAIKATAAFTGNPMKQRPSYGVAMPPWPDPVTNGGAAVPENAARRVGCYLRIPACAADTGSSPFRHGQSRFQARCSADIQIFLLLACCTQEVRMAIAFCSNLGP